MIDDPRVVPVGLEPFDPKYLGLDGTLKVSDVVGLQNKLARKKYVKPGDCKPRHAMVVYSGIIGLQLVNADRPKVVSTLESLHFGPEVVSEIVDMYNFTLVGRSYEDANVLIPGAFDNSFCNLVVIIKCKERRYDRYRYVNDLVVSVYEAFKKAGFDLPSGCFVDRKFQSWKDHYNYWSDSSRYGTAIK
jgi:hypothetical protein